MDRYIPILNLASMINDSHFFSKHCEKRERGREKRREGGTEKKSCLF